MNDDKHAPTDEFVEYLARDTMRRLRHEARFAPAPAEFKSRSRIPTGLAIAAGVVLTLSTGMVLGASANYASAEVLPNGTTTIPSRPTLAILPIKNALTAIGCTQSPEHHAAATKTVAVADTTVVLTKSDTTVEQVVTPPVTPEVVAQTHLQPDRAMIATLVRQHQAAVARGDSVSEYVVMVLDAAQNYLWSTHGSGGVMIEVGGDMRSPAERTEYNRVHAAELMGAFKLVSADSGLRTRLKVGRGADSAWRLGYVHVQPMTDSTLQFKLRPKFADSTARVTVRNGAGRGGVNVDSVNVRRIGRLEKVGDSLNVRLFEFSFARNVGCERIVSVRVPRGGASVGASGRAPATASDTLVRVYTTGFTEPRYASRCNLAAGLQVRGAGESGISGLPSANVSMTEAYVFPAGELAPRDLKVLVVHLTPGTAWSGR